LKENLKEEININENINNFINSIFSHNIDKIDFNLKTYLLNLSSYHLYEKENVYENIYQVLLMQIFIFLKEYGLTGEENSRKDQYDFGFPNKYKKDEYILIEVKFSKSKNGSNEVLKKECKNAINQIEKQKYETKHKRNGYTTFIKYGIVFWKRIGRVEMKNNNGEIQSLSKKKKKRKKKKKKKKTKKKIKKKMILNKIKKIFENKKNK